MKTGLDLSGGLRPAGMEPGPKRALLPRRGRSATLSAKGGVSPRPRAPSGAVGPHGSPVAPLSRLSAAAAGSVGAGGAGGGVAGGRLSGAHDPARPAQTSEAAPTTNRPLPVHAGPSSKGLSTSDAP